VLPPRPSHALFPGTFDPITIGHLDLLRRALGLFDRVTVAVAEHPTKRSLLPADERLALVRRSIAHLERADALALQGLVVEGCRRIGARAIVRGVRTAADLEDERALALTNRVLLPEVETVLLLPAPEVAHVSSTLVRQIACMGGEVGAFVPPPVAEALRGRSFSGSSR